jgi:lipopolysaccharide biosynthesis glycosyltransferase
MRVYIGYDPKEDEAFQVCKFSIQHHNKNVEVIPIKQSELVKTGIYNRPVDPLSTTEFTFTRFLVPYLNNYQGVALFCDCDFVWTGDVVELFNQYDPIYGVQVVKHSHVPTNSVKMDNQTQTVYEKKNWSSCILFNCNECVELTPNVVNTETGLFLHQFKWLPDNKIGSLDKKFNWLVGDPIQDTKPLAFHYTNGGPWFENYKDCEHSDVWFHYKKLFEESLC